MLQVITTSTPPPSASPWACVGRAAPQAGPAAHRPSANVHRRGRRPDADSSVTPPDGTSVEERTGGGAVRKAQYWCWKRCPPGPPSSSPLHHQSRPCARVQRPSPVILCVAEAGKDRDATCGYRSTSEGSHPRGGAFSSPLSPIPV